MLAFLVDGTMPESFTIDQRRKFSLKSRPFLVITGALYRRSIDQIIRRDVSLILSKMLYFRKPMQVFQVDIF